MGKSAQRENHLEVRGHKWKMLLFQGGHPIATEDLEKKAAQVVSVCMMSTLEVHFQHQTLYNIHILHQVNILVDVSQFTHQKYNPCW